jgi:NAD(P)-dependent dehydrogenase (short-subunit alcohol dehydrogenase family)
MADKGMFDLTGKVALVTAAGRGLGREFCQGLAAFGADVACDDIEMWRAQETVELIKQFGHQAIALEADVSKPDQIEGMVAQTVSELGTIDILFCNAGIGNPLVRLHELAIEDWDRVMALNLRGTFLCMRAVLPVMLKQRRGSIILTSSVAGLRAGSEEVSVPNLAPYGASKAAIIGLTRYAAVAYAKDGIRVNAIAPGSHDTEPLTIPQGVEKEKRHKKLLQSIPMGRIARPEEIRGLAVYLASDASSYVTGQVFVEDGGLIA